MKNLLDKCCDEQWRSYLNFHVKSCLFKKNEYIFHHGDPTLGLYIVESGKVKITVGKDQGSQRVIRLATSGDIVGHRGFGGDWTYPINAICYEDTSLNFIPLKVLNSITKMNPNFSYHLMLFFAEELRDSEVMRDLTTVPSKISWVLLKNLEVYGNNKENGFLNFTIPRKDIASFSQATYESVIRILSQFSKENIIEISNKDIRIVDLYKLKDLAKPHQ